MIKVFRKNDRHPEDPRVLIIKDFKGFELWEQRKNLGFEGILLPDAFSREECDFISKDLVKILKDTDYNKYLDISNNNVLLDSFETDHGFSPLTLEKVTQCVALFNSINLPNSNYGTTMQVNTSYPDFPHIHSSTLGAHFSGTSTQFVKPDFKFTAQEVEDGTSPRIPEPQHIYTVNAGDLIIFSEKIWHLAGKLTDDYRENPRTQLLIG